MGKFEKMTRETREREDAVRDRIRGDLRNSLRPLEIAEHLGMSKSAVYRHLQVIRKQDQRWIDEMAESHFTNAYRITLESLENQIRG